MTMASRRAVDLGAVDSILIIKPGSFGDIIHALPCAAALRASLPQAKITWLVDERWRSLLEGNLDLTDTVVFPRQKFRGLAGKLRSIPWALGLRDIRPDIVLDLQGLLRSGLMARLSGAPHIIGLADAREGARFFYHQTTPVSPGEHSVRRYLRTLETLGLLPIEPPRFSLPQGHLPPTMAGQKFVLLHPFARGKGKSLDLAQTIELCHELAPLTVVLAGMGHASTDLPSNTLNLLNQTSIPEMIGLIRAADFVISVDSGPMHIAAAVGTPLLSIHTWSDPRLVGPFDEKAWIWQGGEIRPQRLQTEGLLPGRQPDSSDLKKMAAFVKNEAAS